MIDSGMQVSIRMQALGALTAASADLAAFGGLMIYSICSAVLSADSEEEAGAEEMARPVWERA